MADMDLTAASSPVRVTDSGRIQSGSKRIVPEITVQNRLCFQRIEVQENPLFLQQRQKGAEVRQRGAGHRAEDRRPLQAALLPALIAGQAVTRPEGVIPPRPLGKARIERVSFEELRRRLLA